jgi:hypothetical protein
MSTVYSTLVSLQDAIYDWLDPLATEQFIWAKERAPAPVSPYFSLNLTTMAVAEGAGYERIISGSNRTIVQRRQATLNIQSFGFAAVERLMAIKSRLYLESSQEALVNANISLIRDEDVIDISELLETQIQERASMDLILGYTRSDVDGTNWIEKVQVEDIWGDVTTIG